MKYLFVIALFISLFSKAQSIEGTIISADNKMPVANASVYISGTSIGVVSNEKGFFKITTLPSGSLILVVSSIGYETYSYSFVANELKPISISIELAIKAKEIDAVTVTVYEKDGFKKWGQFFIDNFIGKMSEAKDCVIKNPEVLRFKRDKAQNTLLVKAFDPLIIENKHLGYTLKYDLEGFEYNFKTGVLLYYGYQFFTDLETNRKGKKRRWNKKRLEAYSGSMMHFMRALYDNRIEEEGFEVRRLIKRPNVEKERVRSIMKAKFTNGNPFRITIGEPVNTGDSSAYYNNIMSQPNEVAYLINKTLTADSICTLLDDKSKLLSFDNYLQVVYKNKIETIEYLQQNIKTANKQPSVINSQIVLLGEKKIKVFKKGNYFNPTELLSIDWWSWNEKVATLLPLDYEVEK
ncbi:MAG: carboxypeptidase-like regulatory domain-containing protein [Bacteroidetes bacterium]|nr:carboxypeptidase-like regulatory domain-containing protein [Bacteroidota bacterium]